MSNPADLAVDVSLVVNGRPWFGALQPRLSLADFLREVLI